MTSSIRRARQMGSNGANDAQIGFQMSWESKFEEIARISKQHEVWSSIFFTVHLLQILQTAASSFLLHSSPFTHPSPLPPATAQSHRPTSRSSSSSSSSPVHENSDGSIPCFLLRITPPCTIRRPLSLRLPAAPPSHLRLHFRRHPCFDRLPCFLFHPVIISTAGRPSHFFIFSAASAFQQSSTSPKLPFTVHCSAFKAIAASLFLLHAFVPCFGATSSHPQPRKQLLLLPESDDSAQLSQIETEKLLAQLVEKEMNKRMKEGTYKGKKFNAVCHFFGYQARGSLPSKFDCDYAFVLGHICYHILAAGLNGYMATVTNMKHPVHKWRCGVAPLTAMMTVKRYSRGHGSIPIGKPAIHPASVDLKGKVYELLRQRAPGFLMDDLYRNSEPLNRKGRKIGMKLKFEVWMEIKKSLSLIWDKKIKSG